MSTHSDGFSILNWIGLGERLIGRGYLSSVMQFQYPQLDRFRGKYLSLCTAPGCRLFQYPQLDRFRGKDSDIERINQHALFQYPQLDRFRGKQLWKVNCPGIRLCFSILNWIGLGESEAMRGGMRSFERFSILNWIGLGESYIDQYDVRIFFRFSILNWIGLGES